MYDLILKALKEYNCQYTVDYENNGLPLIDLLSQYDKNITCGKDELELLTEHIIEYLFNHKGE